MTTREIKSLKQALAAYNAEFSDWRGRQRGDLARRHLQAAAERQGLTLAELIEVLEGRAG